MLVEQQNLMMRHPGVHSRQCCVLLLESLLDTTSAQPTLWKHVQQPFVEHLAAATSSTGPCLRASHFTPHNSHEDVGGTASCCRQKPKPPTTSAFGFRQRVHIRTGDAAPHGEALFPRFCTQGTPLEGATAHRMEMLCGPSCTFSAAPTPCPVPWR
jgi:hypothetical protein